MTKVYTGTKVYQSVANFKAYAPQYEQNFLDSYLLEGDGSYDYDYDYSFYTETMKEKLIHILFIFLFIFVLMPGGILLFFHWLGT